MKAGVAKRDITNPNPELPPMDNLFAKALVLDDGCKKLVFVTMDTTGIGARKVSDYMLNDVGEDFLPELRKLVEEELGIPECNVAVNASHTHPVGKLLCDDEEQVKLVFQAVKEAAENLEEVKIGAGTGEEKRISINRTLRMKDGRQWTIRHSNPCPPDDEVKELGPLDSSIGILRVDRLDGTPLAIVYNFACHLLWGDARNRITANIPGIASRALEQSLGNGCMAFFLQGCAGDVMDLNYKDFHVPRDIEKLGLMLADSTLKAYYGIDTDEAEVEVFSEKIRVPRRSDIPEKVERLKEEQAELLKSLHGMPLNFRSFLPLYIQYMMNPKFSLDYSYKYLHAEDIGSVELREQDKVNQANLDRYLQNIKAMEKLARIQDQIATLEKHQKINDASGESDIEMEVQVIKIGDCVLITSPAELLTEIGLRLKKASKFEHTFIAGYTNGYVHYGTPAEDYALRGYEVTECLLAPEWQKLFEETVVKLLGNLK